MHGKRLKVFPSGRRTTDRGQTTIFVLLALSLFLLAAVGFTVDISNLWLHRQMAQNAADAACTAGAIDMFVRAQGGPVPDPNFTPGTAFDCGTTTPNTNKTTAPTPCWYASINGYSSPSTFSALVAGTPSNNVYGSFPASMPGVTAPTGYSSPFLRIDVLDRVRVFFIALLSHSHTKDVRAFAACGLQVVPAPIPVAVLDPTGSSSSLSGSGSITIVGGGNRSLQVNSNYSNSVNVSTINLCGAGPDYCGGSMGVWGADNQDSSFVTSCSSHTPPCSPGPQRTPKWDVPSTPTADPLSQLSAPSTGGMTTRGPGPYAHPNNGTNGCVAYSGESSCDEYAAGNYTNGLCVRHSGSSCPGMSSGAGTRRVAIFDPGVYYITGGMYVDTDSCVRPSTAVGDGNKGTMFYFSDTNSINFNSSGTYCPSNYTTANEKCTAASVLPSNIPSSISDSVLLAPCTGTYGDPLGTSDPSGEQRGILFYQNRSKNAGTSPNFLGGGQVFAAGIMYFHQCVTSGSDTGVGCVSSAFNDSLDLGSSISGSTTYIFGGIVADQINLTSGSSITVNLNPSPVFSVLKTSLLR